MLISQKNNDIGQQLIHVTFYEKMKNSYFTDSLKKSMKMLSEITIDHKLAKKRKNENKTGSF